MLSIYNGGSHKDEVLRSITDKSEIIDPIKSSDNQQEISGNQIFIKFTSSDGYGSKKNFSASIIFGITRAK